MVGRFFDRMLYGMVKGTNRRGTMRSIRKKPAHALEAPAREVAGEHRLGALRRAPRAFAPTRPIST